MRAAALLVCAGVVATSVAWRWTPAAAAKQKVMITFKCEKDGGGSVIVKPWKAKFTSRTDVIEWTLQTPSGEYGVDSVFIGPKLGTQWPFSTAVPIVVTKKQPVVISGIPPYITGGTYKYYVTGVCNVPGVPNDTVGIDPDMIIPKGVGGSGS